MEVLPNVVCIHRSTANRKKCHFQTITDSEDDSSDTDLNDADIESMLNERLPEELKNKKVEAQYDEKFKTVLEGKRKSFFLFLWDKNNKFIHSQRKVKIISKFYLKVGLR